MPQPATNPANVIAKNKPPSQKVRGYPNGNPDFDYNPLGGRNTDSALPLNRAGPVVLQPNEAPVQMSVQQLREAYEYAKTITEPDIYFTGTVYLCNQTRGMTTIDVNPYRYT